MISASRPKVVEYHGTPANGNGPVGSAVVSMSRSEAERSSQRSIIGFELRTRQRPVAARCIRSSWPAPHLVVAERFGGDGAGDLADDLPAQARLVAGFAAAA